MSNSIEPGRELYAGRTDFVLICKVNGSEGLNRPTFHYSWKMGHNEYVDMLIMSINIELQYFSEIYIHLGYTKHPLAVNVECLV